MRTTKLLTTVAFIVIAGLVMGCGESKPKPRSKTPRAAVKLAEAEFLNVVPVADGGAYAKGMWGGLLYLSGGQAVKVVGLGEDGEDTLL